MYIEGYIRDITSEKESSKLNAMLNTYQNAVNSGSLVSITDPKGLILFANDQFCKYSKYSRKELIGQNHRIVNSKYHTEYFFVDMWTTLKSGDTWRGEIRNKAKDGSYYWVDTVITPVFDSRHKIVQYLSIRNIITEKKENEFALIKKQEDLTRAVEEINNRFNEMMQFNYIVSHNMRAPVANVLGLANLLKNNDIDEIEKKSLIESIHFSTLKIDEVLTDLNLILSSKSDINKTKDHISIIEIIGSVFETLNIQHEEKLNHFTIDIEAEAERIISTKSYIESIFYNLISNAIKYKSIERALYVKIKITKILGALQIIFSDNGIGMDLERHGKSIFGLYKRFNSSIEGKGLGLHMTKTQIESLGGNILVESKLNEGTTFTITIPTSFIEKH
jgi:PAS domain S-box-containing protein